jgi:hypothetical protein
MIWHRCRCGNESTQLSGIAHILSVVKRDCYECEMLPLDVLSLVKTFVMVVVSHVLETAVLQLLDVLSAGPTSLKGHPVTWCSVTKKSLKCNHCQHHMNPIETESVLGKHSFFIARMRDRFPAFGGENGLNLMLISPSKLYDLSEANDLLLMDVKICIVLAVKEFSQDCVPSPSTSSTG